MLSFSLLSFKPLFIISADIASPEIVLYCFAFLGFFDTDTIFSAVIKFFIVVSIAL